MCIVYFLRLHRAFLLAFFCNVRLHQNFAYLFFAGSQTSLSSWNQGTGGVCNDEKNPTEISEMNFCVVVFFFE